MAWKPKSRFLKELLKKSDWKKDRNYINDLLFLEECLVNGVGGFGGGLRAAMLQRHYEKEFNAMQRELHPSRYRKRKTREKLEAELEYIDDQVSELEERLEKDQEKKAWKGAGARVPGKTLSPRQVQAIKKRIQKLNQKAEKIKPKLVTKTVAPSPLPPRKKRRRAGPAEAAALGPKSNEKEKTARGVERKKETSPPGLLFFNSPPVFSPCKKNAAPPLYEGGKKRGGGLREPRASFFLRLGAGRRLKALPPLSWPP